MSVLEQAIELYPQAKWDWLALSLNKSISFGFIQTHRDLPWNIPAISRNSSVNEDTVRANVEFPWHFSDLCANPNISFSFILEFVINSEFRIDANWLALSANPSITLDIIKQYPHYPWNDQYLSMNPNITSNYILNEGASRKWFLPYVSANKGITERDIYKNILPWDYLNLGSNPNLPAKYVNDNPNYTWNMYSVSSNPNITTTDIETFHSIKWDPFGLSLNPNISYDYVKSHPEHNWSKQLLLMNSAIDVDTIYANFDYFNIPQMEAYICSNSTIGLAWIKKNIRLIDWKRLSRTQFR